MELGPVHHVSINVGDVAATAAFYTDQEHAPTGGERKKRAPRRAMDFNAGSSVGRRWAEPLAASRPLHGRHWAGSHGRRPHYRALTATTSRSAPVPRIGTLALPVSAACGSPSRGQKPQPSLSQRQVLLFHASAYDELTPPIHRTPPGPHTASSPTEGPPRRAFVPGPPTDPSFDAIVVSFRCVSSGSHMFVLSSHTRPAHRETSTATLTTPALDRRSLRWFGTSAPTATPQDPPPSLAQHGSCRRSSTSSSLPFRTHVGAHNSVVGANTASAARILGSYVPHSVPVADHAIPGFHAVHITPTVPAPVQLGRGLLPCVPPPLQGRTPRGCLLH